MTYVIPQCTFCKRYAGDGDCEAYPEGIPPEIIRNIWDHRQPQPGDHGLQFVALPGEQSPITEGTADVLS